VLQGPASSIANGIIASFGSPDFLAWFLHFLESVQSGSHETARSSKTQPVTQHYNCRNPTFSKKSKLQGSGLGFPSGTMLAYDMVGRKSSILPCFTE
jgi:hypothetical protein